MMKDDLRKPTLEGKAQATSPPSVSRPLDAELTCTEGQVEDLLAEGETTESETDDADADESAEQVLTSAVERKTPPSSKSNRKRK